MRKAVSPLIAGVLLIAITVTIAIILTTWSSIFTTATQSSVENRSVDVVGCSGAAIEIDSLYITGINRSNATAFVRNTGIVNGMRIESAQILLVNGTNVSAQGVPMSGLNRGSILSLNFRNVSIGESCPGNFSKLIVESSCPGASAEFTSAPSCG